jgi:hypothetical protein
LRVKGCGDNLFKLEIALALSQRIGNQWSRYDLHLASRRNIKCHETHRTRIPDEVPEPLVSTMARSEHAGGNSFNGLAIEDSRVLVRQAVMHSAAE